jgi:hypothetical protein
MQLAAALNVKQQLQQQQRVLHARHVLHALLEQMKQQHQLQLLKHQQLKLQQQK